MSEPWDSMVRDAGLDPNTPDGRAMARQIEEQAQRNAELDDYPVASSTNKEEVDSAGTP